MRCATKTDVDVREKHKCIIWNLHHSKHSCIGHVGEGKMILSSKEMIGDFVRAMNECGFDLSEGDIEYEAQSAPHTPHSLPLNKCAVYVFSLQSTWRSPAGPNRVLKVGKAGPNSNARFQSQHYNPRSSQSNLSATLLNSGILWRYLGIQSIDETDVGSWIKENMDRENFFLTAHNKEILGDLEKYIRGVVGPVFEGG